MKNFKLMFTLIGFVLILSLSACSSDSGDDGSLGETTDLLIGEWLVITEHDYYCGTEDIKTERFPDPNQTYTFDTDGTFQKYEEGVAVDPNGTWEYQDENNYSLYYNNDQVTQITRIEFDGNNTMKFGLGDCVEFQGENIETYTVWTRQ